MLSMLMTTEYAPVEDRHELQQLLICIAGGDRDALAELYRRTRTAVYGLALSYLKNAHDAQDLTQDVYVQVWGCAEQGLFRMRQNIQASGAQDAHREAYPRL